MIYVTIVIMIILFIVLHKQFSLVYLEEIDRLEYQLALQKKELSLEIERKDSVIRTLKRKING